MRDLPAPQALTNAELTRYAQMYLDRKESLPLDWLRWLVVIVVAYAAISMLLSARRDTASTTP